MLKKALLALFTVSLFVCMIVGAVAEDSGDANPWIDCQMDIKKAVEVAGFDFSIPALSNFTASAIPGKMIQVVYPRDETSEIVLRKSPIEPDVGEDISGDFTDYPETGVLDVNGVEIDVRRNGEQIFVASFVAFDGAYSVGCTAGMTEAEVAQIMEELLALNAK